MIDIRHELNDFLYKFGGHIGYSVRKSERRRGYTKEMLHLVLEKCKDMNMKKTYYMRQRKYSISKYYYFQWWNTRK